MRLTKKLLSLLHRVFDKDPGPFLALRLRYAGGMTWRIADAVLTTTVTGGPGQNLTVDLSKYTLGELYAYLGAQPGYSLPYGDYSELSLLSARVLMDGSNNIASSNGDHLYGYTSVLWSYMEAQANELQQAEVQIGEMLKQMSTKTAQNEWLDEIGGYYAVPRIQGENDASYGPRIIAEVLRPRGNNVAMEAAIKVFTGQNAKVTDVTTYGDVFPLYNGVITRNSVYLYNASRKPIYGLFDVEYGYNFENGGDIVQFAQIVRELIGRLRDAGTHLRSLLLRGSDMMDTFTPPNDPAEIPWAAAAALDDALTAPDDPEFSISSSFGALSDTFDGATEDAASLISYDYRYNGVRRRNGAIKYVGDLTVIENVDGTSPAELFSVVRAGGRVLDPSIQFSRASVGTYTDRDGLVKTAAAGVPRVDYDPITGAAMGLMIEDVRTNFARYSVYTAANWSRSSGAVVTENAGIAPDGSGAAAFLSATATDAPYTWPGNSSYVAGAKYTASVWFKINPASPSRLVRLVLHQQAFGTGVNRFVLFDVSNGNVSTFTGNAPESYGSTVYPGGWVRVWLTHTATTTVSTYGPLVWFNSNIQPGEGVQFWGLQVEDGTNPTSYIPTNGAAATRDGDRAVMPTAGWLNSSEGTFFAEYELIDTNTDGTILAANNTTQNEQIDMRAWSAASGPRIRSGGVNQSSWALGAVPVPGTTYRMAVAYATDDQGAALNGALGAVDTSCAVPAGIVQLEIGRRVGSGRLNGRVKRILYCPRRLADSQLAALTA